MNSSLRYVFFGTPEIAVTTLNTIQEAGIIPSLVVTNPSKPVGRKQTITPPPVKVWADTHNIPTIQPTTLQDKGVVPELCNAQWDLFVVFAYGKILPEWLLSLPRYGTINAHPSLLPKLRGASPIRSTLLHDLSAAGVSIIQMDAELDHGPLLYQKPLPLITPILGRELDTIMGRECGQALTHVIKELPQGTIAPTEQNHANATYTTKITRDMAGLSINPLSLPTGDEALALYRKICAFDVWPTAFFIHNGKRVKITDATYDSTNQTLAINTVIPEGKKPMDFSTYLSQLQ